MPDWGCVQVEMTRIRPRLGRSGPHRRQGSHRQMIRSRSSRLKTALATVAILAFGAALTATPAAADGPSFNFGINMHGGDMGMGPRPGYDHPRPHFRPMCLTDGQ